MTKENTELDQPPLTEQQSSHIRTLIKQQIVLMVINILCCVAIILLASFARIWVYALYIAVPLVLVSVVLSVLMFRAFAKLRRYVAIL